VGAVGGAISDYVAMLAVKSNRRGRVETIGKFDPGLASAESGGSGKRILKE